MDSQRCVNQVDDEEQRKMNTESNLKFLGNMPETACRINIEDIQMLEVFRSCVQQGELLREKFANAVQEKRRVEMELVQAEMKRSTLQTKVMQARSLIELERNAEKEAFRMRNHLQKQRDDILRVLPETQRCELFSHLRPIQNDSLDSTSDIHFTTDTTSSSAIYLSETDSDDRHLFPPSHVSKRRNVACKRSSSHREQLAIVKHEDNVLEKNIRSYIHSSAAANLVRESVNSSSFLSNTSVAANLLRESSDSSSFLSDSNMSALFYTAVMENLKTRPHKFHVKRFVLGDRCIVCQSKMLCGAQGMQCDDCHCVTHRACENLAPKPCISMSRIRKNSPWSIGDYCPQFRPYIPSLVVHCILQIEERGLKEAGLYKVPSFDRSVQDLKNQLLANRGVPNLSQIDVKIICELLKDFFASLKPSLITSEVFDHFKKYFEHNSKQQITYTDIYDDIRCLEPASKDTLAFLILHLQNVVNSPACKMSSRSLSKIFTPLLVDNYKTECYKKESQKWSLTEKLIRLPADVWKCVLLKDL